MGVLINNEPMLRINRHPILIDHETQVVLDLRPGESLHSFLSRHIENMDGQPMVVTVGGKSVQREMWTNVYPKGGHTIEVRFGVGKTALLIVALIALTVFTMGAAAAVAAAAAGGAAATGVGVGFAAGLAAAGITGTAAMAVIGAVQIVGAMLINKVLGPKVPKPASIERDSVYNAAGARNSVRQYEPFGLLFGVTRVAPDVISIPYTQYINNDQYMAEVFSPGINVNRFDALYLGDTPLTNYQDVQVWTAGFAGMPQQTIPLFTNVDTIAGGVLEADFAPGPWIERTGSPDSIRLQVDITFLLFDLTSKGKKKVNREQIQIQYKPVGTSTWLSGPQPFISSDSQTETRRTYGWDVAAGQYDIRVRRMGRNTDGSGATAEFSLASIVSIQRDTANYRGIPRIGVQVKATGQLNGALDELRAIMYANPMPMWNGNAWVTATDRSNGLCNPGAQILQYVRGFRDEDGVLIAGMGLPDSQIDIESLKAFMTHCRVNNFTYNQWITDSRTHDEIISAIALAGMGRYTWAPGRFTMIWAAEGQPHEGVANMGNIKKGEFQIDYSLSQAADGIEYTYIDGVSFETKTLRVPAPGVTIMTNPARLTGEGVDNETQAALIARYHLAQSIYQFKDVVFSMGIECLSFGQMSMIQLQHDLTQWGYGGRLMSAGRDAQNRVVLKFDEPVPGPQGNGAYVGLRIAGEANFRVFRILAFAGYSDTVTLIDAWPSDAAFPGNSEKNPAWDTLYLYDFKQTPGLRCRVTGISPGDDLSGASISVVPESDEFWNYVKTGEYIPPKNESLLRPGPVVSNLRAREERVVQGDTVFSNLNANWRVSGYAEYVIVTCARQGQLPVEVARTSALSATWRVEDPGDYTIVVRPYGANGVPGEAQVLIHTVMGAVLPPVNPDLLTITELDGGIRKYSWGWLASTIQSPDFAGVEIRYIEGTVSQPDWLAMTPLGNGPDAGYHTTAFESTNPAGGDWTFALRAVNTSGVISDQMLVVQRTLSNNLGEVIDEINNQAGITFEQLQQEVQDRIEGVTAEANARQEAIEQEITERESEIDRLETDIATNADSLLNEKLEREAAIENEQTLRQSADESLALQISSISAGTGTQFDSKLIWYFDTDAEGWNGVAQDGFLNPGGNVAISPAGVGVTGTEYRYLKARVKRVGNPAWLGLLRFDILGQPSGTANLTQPTWDANGIGTLDLDEIPWTAGVVDRISLQLAPSVDGSNYFLFDYVAIGRPTPGASVAMVQEETQARINADGALAQQTNTLAVQMRGEYDGTDIANVTQGLVYSERQARITADGAIAQDVSSLQVRAGEIESSVTTESQARISGDEANAQSIQQVSAALEGKASVTALNITNARVTEVEGRVETVASSTLKLESQLNLPHAGSNDLFTGSTTSYAGAISAYSIVNNGDLAQAIATESLRADFGNYSASANTQLAALSTSQSAQALSITQLQAVVGNAGAGAISILQSDVATLNEVTTLNSQAITQVNARVDGKAEASVVQQMGVTVSQTSTKVTQIDARYFLGVDVNGLLAGMYIGNNGATSVIRFRSDLVTFEKPGGGPRLEMSGGALRAYDENRMRARFGTWS